MNDTVATDPGTTTFVDKKGNMFAPDEPSTATLTENIIPNKLTSNPQTITVSRELNQIGQVSAFFQQKCRACVNQNLDSLV